MIDPLTNVLAALEAAGGAPSAVGTGVAADGLIEVRAAQPGRVTGLHLDPAVLAWPVQELAAELTAAVNAALADLRAGLPHVDPGRLREIQEQATRQFAAFTDSLLDAQATLARRAGEPR